MTTKESIRYVSFVFDHPDLDERVAYRLDTYEEYDGCIHYADLSETGKITGLVRFHGGDNAVSEITDIMDRDPYMEEYELDVADEIQVYTHLKPLQWTEDLHRVIREHEILLDWPIKPTNSSLEVTILGCESELKGAIEKLNTEWNISILRTGDYQSFSQSSELSLTPHQRKILKVAVREGYYDIPKRTTQQNLASELDLATGTVAEHLRKIESKALRSMID